MILLLTRKSSRLLSRPLSYGILQDSKRLRTFQVPQQSDIHPIPKQFFEDAVLLTLIRLQSAFQKLKSEQPPSSPASPSPQQIKSIQLHGLNKLQIESGLGWFIFEGKQELSTFFYTSPFNGVFKYYYDLDSKRWLSNKDKHIMEENVAREVQGKFSAYLDI